MEEGKDDFEQLKKKLNLDEFCHIIDDSRVAEKQINDMVKLIPRKDTLYIDAMNLHMYKNDLSFRKAIDEAISRDVLINCILAEEKIDDVDQILLTENNINFRLIPEEILITSNIPYWGDTFCSSLQVIILEPHSPFEINHHHVGFYCKDTEIINLINTKILKLWNDAKNKTGEPPKGVSIVNNEYFNRNEPIFEKELKDQWILIERGTLVDIKENKEAIMRRAKQNPEREKLLWQMGENFNDFRQSPKVQR